MADGDRTAEVDALLAAYGDWRGETLGRVRELLLDELPDVTESAKWKKPSNPGGVPAYEQDGMLCTLEGYRDKVKVTFAYGAHLDDPTGLFNASLGGATRRAIDLREGDELDADAFRALARAAAEHNAG